MASHVMQKTDIIAISEHGLYDSQLWKLSEINESFKVTAKACKALNDDMAQHHIGHSGVALFWRDTLSQ